MSSSFAHSVGPVTDIAFDRNLQIKWKRCVHHLHQCLSWHVLDISEGVDTLNARS